MPTSAVAQDELVHANLNAPKGTRAEWKTIALQSGVTLGDLSIETMSKHSKE